MKCDVCGSDNLEGAAYCEDCGAKLVVMHAVVGAAPAPPPPVAVAPVAPLPVPASPSPAGQGTGDTSRCPSCGADNPSSEAYCVDCGANLGTCAPVATPMPVSVPAPVVTVPPLAPPSPPVASAVLKLADGTKDFSLDREITTMGRRSLPDQIDPDVDVTPHDPESYVSRRHAQIVRNEGQYLFEDVGSSNGSFINNVRAQPGVQQPLKDLDRIRLGKTEFVFHSN